MSKQRNAKRMPKIWYKIFYVTIFVVKVLLDFNILNLYMKYGKIIQIM